MKVEHASLGKIVGITALAGLGGVILYTVKVLTADGSTTAKAIGDAVKIVANDLGTAFKAVIIGVGVGFVLFLLLPPPFDLIALGLVAAVAMYAAYTATDKITNSQIANDVTNFESSTWSTAPSSDFPSNTTPP